MSITRGRKVASTVVSLRMSQEQTERLRRRARQLRRTPSETGAMLLDEALRRADFAFIDFRDAALCRHAYVMGSRLAVWQVVSVVGAFGGDLDQAARHLAWPVMKVRAAIQYAEAFPDEIDTASTDDAAGELRRSLPQLEELVVPPAARSCSGS